MRVDWDWGRERSEEILAFCHETPNEWRVAADVLVGNNLEEIWTGLVKPVEYFLKLEDNIELKVEEIWPHRKLMARYVTQLTLRQRLKRFCERLGTAWNRW